MLNYAEITNASTIVSVPSLPHNQSQEHPTDHAVSTFSYTIGPIDPSHLVSVQAHCSNGERCLLLLPKHFPLWILNHLEFRDGYERNFFTEEDEDNAQWGTVPHMINLIYTKLCGEGFGDLVTGEVEPDFGAWEIGWLLRDFTRLAETDRTLALTGMAHLCFLLAFLPTELPTFWPPVGLMWARYQHNKAVKTFRARVRGYREQGKNYDEAQRFALC